MRLIVVGKWIAVLTMVCCAGVCGMAIASDTGIGSDVMETIVPEHGKINTGDPTPVDPGHYEIEVDYGYLKARRAFNERRHSSDRGLYHVRELALTLTIGLADDWDMYFGLPAIRIEDRDSDPNRGNDIADISLGARYRFINDETNHLEIAYTAGFIAPTGSDDTENEIGTSQQFWSLEQAVILAKDWGRWTMNTELGYSYPFGHDSDDANGSVALNTAVGYQITAMIQPELELNYGKEFGGGGMDAHVLAATAGLVMPFNDTFLMKAGVVKDISGSNVDKATHYLINLKLAF